MFVSQSILSRHIRELEEEVGCELFVRDTHTVSLTEEGKHFLRWVRIYLERTERVLTAMSNARAGEAGTIQIDCSEQSLNTPVLSFLQRFREDYSRIHLDLHPLSTGIRRENLYSCDLLLTPCDFTNLHLLKISFAMLTRQEPLLALPPYHHLEDRQEVTLADLKGETLIVPFADELFGPYARNAMAAGRKCHGDLPRIGAADAAEGLLRVEMGEGLMLIPHHLKPRVYPHTRTIPVSDSDCVFPIYIYLNNSRQNPAAHLFFEQIVKIFEA